MTSFRFEHGLGDTANLCRLLPLYAAQGHQIEVATTPDKAPLIELAGGVPVAQARTVHHWAYPPDGLHGGPEHHHRGNKVAGNISRPPLPDIGPPAEVWRQLADQPGDISDRLPRAVRERAAHQLAGLPRPVCLLHSIGNTDQRRKSLTAELQRELYLRWLDQTDGTLILLDWDTRVEQLHHRRLITLDQLGGAGTLDLLALIAQSDLLIGVDSGPLHLAGLTDTPALGLWTDGHHPARYLIPRLQTLSLCPSGIAADLNRAKRAAFRIVESGGHTHSAADIIRHALRLLQSPMYATDPRHIGDDALLQWIISQQSRAHVKTVGTTGAVDRGRSFDRLLKEAARRFKNPRIIETGTIRSMDDYGAGWSTWLFGLFARATGGHVESIDLDPKHCDFSRHWTADFGDHVTITHSRGDDGISARDEPIDMLYLDSCDTEHPQHQEVCLQELQAALPRLQDDSLILIDDSPTQAGQRVGKGAQAIPWLIDHGWRVRYDGYQVLLDHGGKITLPPSAPLPAVSLKSPAGAQAGEAGVVYTAIFGDRDELRDPPEAARTDGVQWVCFSDRPRASDVWDVRVVESRFACPRLAAREYKLLPHVWFPDAPWSIWIDGCLQLLRNPLQLYAELISPRHDLAAFPHPERNCLFDEAEACRQLAMTDPVALNRQLALYRAAGLEVPTGLIATGLLIRRHTSACIQLCEDWFREAVLFSARDQISFPYVAQRHGFRSLVIEGGIHTVDWLKTWPHHQPEQDIPALQPNHRAVG